MNDAEPYIAAVADACHAAGLFVADYESDDIDPRDGITACGAQVRPGQALAQRGEAGTRPKPRREAA